MKLEEINQEIKKLKDTNGVSDGYHTFGELYNHRITLFAALCNLLVVDGKREYDDIINTNVSMVWKSYLHHDLTSFDGWFIAGINFSDGSQITYHIPNERWDEFDNEELAKAPEFDGHTSEDVISRIKNYLY